MQDEKRSVSVQELIQATLSHMEAVGYTYMTRESHIYAYRAVARYAENTHQARYTEEVGQNFLQHSMNRTPPLSARRLCILQLSVRWLDHVLAEDFDWRPDMERCKKYARSRYDSIVIAYEAYLKATEKADDYVRRRTHAAARFLQFVDDSGIDSLENLTLQCIHAGFQAAISKDAFHNGISAFLKYAWRQGLTPMNMSALVPSVRRHKPVPSVFSPEEVEIFLAAIDRAKKNGKRNYAIALLAARLGIRASDIANLSFKNIRFDKETIELVQIKTKEPITLPLLPEIRAALIDYMENERPSFDSDKIFLKSTGLIQSRTICAFIQDVFLVSGIDLKGRHYGPHALRASLATALLDEGHGYLMIQKALGHRTPDAAQSYVKVEADRLRTCALAVPKPSAKFARLLGLAVEA